MNLPDPSRTPQRHERQWRYAPIGLAGQERLKNSRVLVAGCGALGSVSAEMLVRAGIGHLRIIDRDFPEWNNLQRQSLYTEEDVRAAFPKAVAAADHLRAIDSRIQIEPIVGDVRFDTILPWLRDVDVIVDGTDNFETRFLLNDASCETKIPWVFAGVLGAEGQSMTIVPGQTACLRCLMPLGPPAVGESPTCDTAGIIAPIIHVMAAIQVTEVLKLLLQDQTHLSHHLTVIDLWDHTYRKLDLASLRDSGSCPTCQLGAREWLSGDRAVGTAVLCGRNAVQLQGNGAVDPLRLAKKFAAEQVRISNPFLVRLQLGEHLFTVFADGRIIVSGTEDPVAARSLAAKHLGL